MTTPYVPNTTRCELVHSGFALFLFHSSVSDHLTVFHDIAVMLNETEPDVKFDWCEAFLKGGPPYVWLYQGDYDKAVRAFHGCLDRINTILEPAWNAKWEGKDVGEWRPLSKDSLVSPNMKTLGQAFLEHRQSQLNPLL